MRAFTVELRRPGSARLEDLPDPEPAAGEVLVTLGAGDVFRLGEALVGGGGP